MIVPSDVKAIAGPNRENGNPRWILHRVSGAHFGQRGGEVQRQSGHPNLSGDRRHGLPYSLSFVFTATTATLMGLIRDGPGAAAWNGGRSNNLPGMNRDNAPSRPVDPGLLARISGGVRDWLGMSQPGSAELPFFPPGQPLPPIAQGAYGRRSITR